MLRPRLIALFLALATLLVYLPVTTHEFLNCDDTDYVTANPMVAAGLTPAGIHWAFTAFCSGNWHPLTWLSHMTDCQLFGLNPAAHHLVNALFHAANTALLFLLLWRLTGLLPPAVVAAALFAGHPMHVESVAWVAERKDVLSTFFALLALLSYVHYARHQDRRSYGCALVFLALGLLSKPMVVTLPCLFLLLDFWPLQRLSFAAFRWPVVWEKIPFFALAAVSSALTYAAQSAGHAVITLAQLPMSYRLENVPVAISRYLGKLVWPAHLAIVYPYGPIPFPTALLGGLVVVLVTGAVWWARRQSRWWLFGWLWFLGTLIPVIGLVQVGVAALADRYTYLPSVGLFVAVAFGLYEWAGARRWFAFVAAVPLAACIVVTESQLAVWRNSETLFRHAITLMPDNRIAHNNLAVALDEMDRPAEALAEYRTVLRLDPDRFVLHYYVGEDLRKLGRPAEALAEYWECLLRNPQEPEFHAGLAAALAASGDLTNAIRECHRTEKLDPHYSAPHLELAKIYFQQGRNRPAADELRAAVAAQPDDPPTLAAVARCLAANADDSARDGDAALALALKANDLAGQRDSDVFDALGIALAATGDFTNAVICAQNAITFAPNAQRRESGALPARLRLYQNHQPWRESFRGTNAPAR